MKLRHAALLVVSLAVVPAVAYADTPPSVWERARDPAVGDAYSLHQQAQQRIFAVEDDDAGPPDPRNRKLPPSRDAQEREWKAAQGMLENYKAETSKSPLLRFDLALVYELLLDYGRAAKIYKAAIAEFPDYPRVERAWLRLAFACGHLGDHECERNAYLKVLQIETEELHRATPMLNLAETQMHLGDLQDAMEGYREALRIAGRLPPQYARETGPLATWGLAVALDRAGDRHAAEKEARFALELERSMGMHLLLRSKGVFFVPEYEVTWYEGLGAIARARVASSAREATTLWRQAERSFGEYVAGAEAADKKPRATPNRWLPIAKARLAQATSERTRTEKLVPREPPPLESGPDLKL